MYSTRDDNWNYVRFTVEDFFVNTTSSSKKSGRAVSVWTVFPEGFFIPDTGAIPLRVGRELGFSQT